MDDIPKELIEKAQEKEEEIKNTENIRLRYLLWLRHGCDGLYGDDGEMQCNKCGIDFKRDSIERIEKVFYNKGLKAMEKLYLKQLKDKIPDG